MSSWLYSLLVTQKHLSLWSYSNISSFLGITIKPLVNVLLLKEYDAAYSNAFASYSNIFKTISFQPVLAFEFINQDQLAQEILHDSSYDSIILTSPRAAEALGKLIETNHPTLLATLKTFTYYVVGRKTKAALISALRNDDQLAILGESCGNASQLAALLNPNFKYLFLCGNKRRDTIPNALASTTRSKELVVYNTIILNLNLSLENESWVVYFSPSGTEAFLPSFSSSIRLAAIGRTTRCALETKLSTYANQNNNRIAVAKKPTAESLVKSILRNFNYY